MASVLKDPAVVEAIAKAVEKAKVSERKAVLTGLKNFHAAHKEGLGDAKASIKLVNAFHTGAQAVLKAPSTPAAE